MEILKLIRTHAVIPFLYLHDYYNGLNFNNTIGVFIKWTFNYSVVIEILASFYCTLKFNNNKKNKQSYWSFNLKFIYKVDNGTLILIHV